MTIWSFPLFNKHNRNRFNHHLFCDEDVFLSTDDPNPHISRSVYSDIIVNCVFFKYVEWAKWQPVASRHVAISQIIQRQHFHIICFDLKGRLRWHLLVLQMFRPQIHRTQWGVLLRELFIELTQRLLNIYYLLCNLIWNVLLEGCLNVLQKGQKSPPYPTENRH